MAKSRTEKDKIIDQYMEKLQDAKAMYVIKPIAITPNEANKLRKEFSKSEASFNVVKNTLFQKALEKAGLDFEGFDFEGENAVVFCSREITPGAKVIYDFVKESEKGEIKFGFLDGSSISKMDIEELAKLPSREVLLSITVGTIAAPLVNFVNVLNANIVNLVNVLKNLSEVRS